MGIAPFGKNASKQIYPDPYLSWVIPSDWSLEDAATVPLSYSLVYYSTKYNKELVKYVYELNKYIYFLFITDYIFTFLTS